MKKFALCVTTYAKQNVKAIDLLLSTIYANDSDLAVCIVHIDNCNGETKMLDYLHAHYPKLDIIHSDQRIGVSESRNKLMQHVKTKYKDVVYIKLSDDDDESMDLAYYINVIKKYDKDLSKEVVIEGTSSLKRVNFNMDKTHVVQTCLKNDYLLVKNMRYLHSICKFSKGMTRSVIIPLKIMLQIPFLTLTSYEDVFFRYMLYEYCRIFHIPYYFTSDLMYIYHGPSNSAINFKLNINANSIKMYDELYYTWCKQHLNYVQLLKFVFSHISSVMYVDSKGNGKRCNTISDLQHSIVDFKSFGAKMDKEELIKLLKTPVITDVDIYYTYISQYITYNKFKRYVNNNPDKNMYEPKTYTNIMQKYPTDANNDVIDAFNRFSTLHNTPVNIMLFSEETNFYIQYSINGNEASNMMSNNILYQLML